MMKQQSEYLRLFLDVTKTITPSLDPKEVFELTVTKIPQVVHVDAATIRLRLNASPPWQSNAASPSKMRGSMTSSNGS